MAVSAQPTSIMNFEEVVRTALKELGYDEETIERKVFVANVVAGLPAGKLVEVPAGQERAAVEVFKEHFKTPVSPEENERLSEKLARRWHGQSQS